MDSDDDLYRADGDEEKATEEDPAEEVEAVVADDAEPEPKASVDVEPPAADEATEMDAEEDKKAVHEKNAALVEQLAAKDAQLAELQRQVDQWRTAFRDEAKGVTPDPGTVLDNLLELRASQRKASEQVREYKKREDALVLRIQCKDQEIHDFKIQVRELNAQLKPANKELYKLALDPAVHREFTRLQNELDEKEKALKAAQEEVEMVQYTTESKMGRRLRARLQTVLKENEELALQIKEGKVQRLETELAMLKDYLNEMKRLDRDLVDDAQMLDEESAELQQHLFVLQNRIASQDEDQPPAKRGRTTR